MRAVATRVPAVELALRVAGDDQVVARRRSSASASSVAATLSGLSPERANETSSVGTSSAKHARGVATMSVVATASTRARVRRAIAGATISPANAELPAPVRTIRRTGSAATPATSSETSRQSAGLLRDLTRRRRRSTRLQGRVVIPEHGVGRTRRPASVDGRPAATLRGPWPE